MGKLTGKVAFVTGSARNQGRAVAELFAAEGAFVMGCDILTEESEATAERVRAGGGQMVSMAPVDLADPDGAKAWIDFGLAAAGGIDILYNNAASGRLKPFEETSADDWTFTLHNELDILFHVVKAAWPHFIARGGGSIITVASICGLLGSRFATAHCVGKAGALGFNRQLTVQGAPHRIRANAISPGPIATPGLLGFDEKIGGQLLKSIPLGRYGQPQDVANCALFLASDESSFVTGANITVDGGISVGDFS